MTAKKVIENYLGQHATELEKSRLVTSQALAFSRHIQSQKIPEVSVRKFSNIDEIAHYLRTGEPKS